MRMIQFAKRNFKELMRDPLNLIFCIAFPLVLLVVFEVISKSMALGKEQIEQAVPQFMIQRLTPSMCVFGFSFLTLFSGTLISKDRNTSLLSRLRTSPMSSVDFIFGYTLPLIPVAILQIIICYLTGFCFGLKPSINLLPEFAILLFSSLIFISLGLLLGSLFNEKVVPGLSSLFVNISAIFGGMFMPLENLNQGFQNFAYSMPVANVLRMVACIENNTYTNFILSFIICTAYLLVCMAAAVICFRKVLSSD